MAMVSAVQEAQKDNLRSFNDYMLKVLEVSVPNGLVVMSLSLDFTVYKFIPLSYDHSHYLYNTHSCPWKCI